MESVSSTGACSLFASEVGLSDCSALDDRLGVHLSVAWCESFAGWCDRPAGWLESSLTGRGTPVG